MYTPPSPHHCISSCPFGHFIFLLMAGASRQGLLAGGDLFISLVNLAAALGQKDSPKFLCKHSLFQHLEVIISSRDLFLQPALPLSSYLFFSALHYFYSVGGVS